MNHNHSADRTRIFMLTFYVLGTVAAAAAGVAVQKSGGLRDAVLAALFGIIATGVIKYGLWKRYLTWREALQNALVLGVLAAAGSSNLNIWQAPTTWPDLLTITSQAATVAGLLYLVLLAYTLGTSGRHLSPAAGLSLVLAPFLFNVLLLLESPSLIQQIGQVLTLDTDLSAQWRQGLGQLVIIFVFNEAVTGCLHLLLTGRLTGGRLHSLLAVSAAMAALSPWLARWGSAAALGSWPIVYGLPLAVASGMLAQAGLWGQTYLITGMFMDALHGRRPTWSWGRDHYKSGFFKGAVYTGLFLGLIHTVDGLTNLTLVRDLLRQYPLVCAGFGGLLIFPLLITIIDSFDGSRPFIHRLRNFYGQYIHCWRGLIVGVGVAYALTHGVILESDSRRFFYGLAVGVAAYAAVNLGRDLWDVLREKRYQLQSPRIYLVQAVMGGLAGGALAWYFDAGQLGIVVSQFKQYATIHFDRTIEKDIIYPLFSKWGAIDLGQIAGGVGMLYNQSLAGVINWSIAAPLFSVNLVALNSMLQGRLEPLRNLFTRRGLAEVIEQAFRVQRWGLWMAPIIFSFLKMSADPTWYNQDGAIRTIVATIYSLVSSPEAFRAWSLNAFTSLLAYDWFRILIYFDHMGLRVATLVNLSFVGLDRLDGVIARFCGHPGRSRIIPTGLRRFATWAPLLIPFYIPRGRDWDQAWNQSQAIIKVHPGELFSPEMIAGGFLFMALTAGAFLLRRSGGNNPGKNPATATPDRASPDLRPWPPAVINPRTHTLSNGLYTLTISSDGRSSSRVFSLVQSGQEIDITRRGNDPGQQGGKYFYLKELTSSAQAGDGLWSLTYLPLGHVGDDYQAKGMDQYSWQLVNTYNSIKAEALVCLDRYDPVEVWKVRLTNLEPRPRIVELTSYQELALNTFNGYRRHPDYNHIHVGTWFIGPLQAILAKNRHLKNGHPDPVERKVSSEVAFHAGAAGPGTSARLTGYEDSRLYFLGHQTLRDAVGLRRPLRDPGDQGLLYTFAPMAALRFQVDLPPDGAAELIFVDGYADHESTAADYIQKYLGIAADPGAVAAAFSQKRRLHGFGAPGDLPEPSPAGSPVSTPDKLFAADGTEIKTTWNTERPWTHVMANELGYGTVVNSEGDVYSFMGNSQQNGLTPAWTESTPVQTPGQAVYLVNTATGRITSPTYLPVRNTQAAHEVTFGRGYAVYQSCDQNADQSLTIFVPPDLPAEIRLLTVTNRGTEPITYRVVFYLQMVLAEIPEDSRWGIISHYDQGRQIQFFSSQRNTFHQGWAFVATSLPVAAQEMLRPRFLGGPDRDLSKPFFVEHGHSDETQADDGFRVAGLAGTLTVAPGGTETVVMILGQARNWEEAADIVQPLRNPQTARATLEKTKGWWQKTLSVLRIQTNRPAFDRLVNDWLPYQALVARLWGRTGPNQRSGGFGYRDQLQDTLPFLVLDPARTRRQILLHAGQQFHDGDVMQWWHPGPDGKTGLGARNRASDPHLWLAYMTYHYLEATADLTILDEMVPFLEGESIPYGEEGTVFVPLISKDSASLYEHCLRAIDFTLRLLGPHGLPLMGTGDWNDGMNLLGFRGRGESVWMGFFLYDIISHWVPIIEARNGIDLSRRYLDLAAKLKISLESAWRDGRYARAFTDSGRDLVFADALTASWPVIAGVADLKRSAEILDLACRELVQDHSVLLLTPPFTDESTINPGRLSTYPPGVRENGGQYSHGCSWLVDALVKLAEMAEDAGDRQLAAQSRDRAMEVWTKISPLGRMEPEVLRRCGLPPHQQPADVYHGYGYDGRGGWSWYTGSAARMLFAAYQLLGLKMKAGELLVSPAGFAVCVGLKLARVGYKGKNYTKDSLA